MKNNTCKVFAIVLAMMLLLSSGIVTAFAEKPSVSNVIHLGDVKYRPTETEETVETEEKLTLSADTEAHAADNANSAVKFTLSAGTEVTVLQKKGDWAEVSNPDGKHTGWILLAGGEEAEIPEQPATDEKPAEPEEQPEAQSNLREVAFDVEAHAAPNAQSAVKFTVAAGTEVEVLKESTGWWQVANAEGKKGWIYTQGETETRTADGELREGVIIAGTEDGVQLLDKPEGEVLEILPVGSNLIIVAVGDDWTKVKTETADGYIRTDALALLNAKAKEDEKIRSVEIVNSLAGQQFIDEGTIATFSVLLTGFENDTYVINWYEAPAGGEYRQMEGEHGLSVSFPVTSENIRNSWRVEVTLTNAE